MASPAPAIDLGAILNAIGQWFVSFFNVLVQYAPVILAVTVVGYLVYKYAGTIRRSISQLIGLF
jgi:predicted membrane-bound mannosyltransferase